MKKNIIFSNNFTILLKYSIFLIIIFFIFSCNKKKEAYIFYNSNYYYIFNDEYKIYKLIKKKLNRNFYDVNEISFSSFESLPDKINEITLNNKTGFFYINDFLTPFLLKKVNIPENNRFKILTYNLQIMDDYYNKNFFIFNILFDTSILEKKALNLIKKYSKKDDLSDCGLLINSNYSLPLELNANFKKNNNNFNLLEIDKLDEKVITDWIKEKKMKAILLFGYDFNSFVLNIKENENEYKDIIFIEFLTNYGKISNTIEYKIDIIWDSTLISALESKEFKNFLTNDNEFNENINNYIVNNKNLVFIEKYKKNKIKQESIN